MTDFTSFTDNDKTFWRSLRAVFVMAPREMSEARLTQLVKMYLAKGNVIFGVATEPYVDGFDGQPQFKTLPAERVQKLVAKIAHANIPHTLHVLSYMQQDVDDVVRAIRPRRMVIVRGSYLYPFHRGSTYALLEKRSIPFEYVSPFVDETEALSFLDVVSKKSETFSTKNGETLSELEVLELVSVVAHESFDYSFQTGAILAETTGGGYSVVDGACNEVVPYQTYALHFGNAREMHQSAHQSDAVHYDTIHAEMNLLVRAMKHGVSFEGRTLFINMLPCPNCARTLVKTGLHEVVYQQVHSDGYAVDLFEKAGINTRRIQT